MRLRPHHLLCTQAYEGKGYSEDFVGNMNAITSRLRGDKDIVIKIVLSTDDICNKCPLMLGEDLCKTNEKVKTMDKKIVDYFGIEEKEYIYSQIINKINTNMTEDKMDNICIQCEWYTTSSCKEKILRGVQQ